ncbi:atrophin-1-like isoform X2 [Engraulis encrasicolus]|uniref:atrophin-1-like isoform X2 n=1 Tax=Engraulis encrasicolus TaxID=184585 RepID=UPI002FD4E1D1
MPHSCIYPGCGLKHKPYNEESFHELPYRHDDQELLQRWLTVLNIDITTPVETLKEKRYRVCSRHFDKDDFIQPRTVKENRVQRVRVQLKKYAIPRPRVGPPATGTVEVPDAGSSSPLSVYSSTGPSSPVPMPTVAASYAESLPSLPLATVKEEGGSAAVCGAVWNSHTHTGSNHTPLTHIHEREHSYAEGRSTPFLRSEKISLQEEVTVQVSCLLQLFDRCLGCSAGSCSVLTRRDGRVFHVTQQCWTCQIIVEWDSHTADSGTANKQQEGRGEGGGERGVVEIKEEWEEIQVQEEEEEQPREEQPGEEQPREEQRGAGRRKQRRREERVEEETPLETLDEDEEDEDAVEGEGISGKQRGRKRRRKKMMRRMRMQDINEQDDDDYDEEGEDNDEEYDEEEEKVQWLEKAKKRREEMDQDWAPEDDQMLPESERRSSCSEEYDDDDGVDDEDWERELCSECGKKFRNRPDKPHVCLHKAKPVECHICGKRCLNEQGLSVHIAHCHERGPQCKYCNTTLRHPARHICGKDLPKDPAQAQSPSSSHLPKQGLDLHLPEDPYSPASRLLSHGMDAVKNPASAPSLLSNLLPKHGVAPPKALCSPASRPLTHGMGPPKAPASAPSSLPKSPAPVPSHVRRRCGRPAKAAATTAAISQASRRGRHPAKASGPPPNHVPRRGKGRPPKVLTKYPSPTPAEAPPQTPAQAPVPRPSLAETSAETSTPPPTPALCPAPGSAPSRQARSVRERRRPAKFSDGATLSPILGPRQPGSSKCSRVRPQVPTPVPVPASDSSSSSADPTAKASTPAAEGRTGQSAAVKASCSATATAPTSSPAKVVDPNPSPAATPAPVPVSTPGPATASGSPPVSNPSLSETSDSAPILSSTTAQAPSTSRPVTFSQGPCPSTSPAAASAAVPATAPSISPYPASAAVPSTAPSISPYPASAAVPATAPSTSPYPATAPSTSPYPATAPSTSPYPATAPSISPYPATAASPLATSAVLRTYGRHASTARDTSSPAPAPQHQVPVPTQSPATAPSPSLAPVTATAPSLALARPAPAPNPALQDQVKAITCVPVPVVEKLSADSYFKTTKGRRKCRLCSRQTIYKCRSCNVPLCIIVDRLCFTQWHDQGHNRTQKINLKPILPTPDMDP